MNKSHRFGFRVILSLKWRNDVFTVAGQNQIRYGGRQFFDVRKLYTTEDNKRTPSKVGVRFPLNMLPELKGALTASIEMSANLCESSGRIMRFTKLALVEKEINALRKLRINCYGCFIDHPSQKQHDPWRLP